MRSYGQEVRSARTSLGMTLETVARRVGTHKGYVSSIENDKVNPPAARVTLKLSRVLKLNPDRMLALAVLEKMPRKLTVAALFNVCMERLDEDRRAEADASELVSPALTCGGTEGC